MFVMIRMPLLLLVALLLSGAALADTYRMYVGDMKVLRLGHITRVAVGNYLHSGQRQPPGAGGEGGGHRAQGMGRWR